MIRSRRRVGWWMIRLPRYVAVGPHRRNDGTPSDPGILTVPPDDRFGSTAAVLHQRERVSFTPAGRQSAGSIDGLLGANS
jgi:hypothetical protein